MKFSLILTLRVTVEDAVCEVGGHILPSFKCIVRDRKLSFEYLLLFEKMPRLHMVDLSVPVVSGHEPAHWVPHHVEVLDVTAKLREVGEVEVAGVNNVVIIPTENPGKVFLLRPVEHPQVWGSLSY